MKILLTGATGYIGQRLLPVLLEQGHEVVCAVRDVSRFNIKRFDGRKISLVELDLLKKETLKNIPTDVEAAYYLVHSMSTTADFGKMEETSAQNFIDGIASTSARQIVYLGGIVNEKELSEHLKSRKKVEEVLRKGSVPVTSLRAGIIVGSGSASFEIIRDLVEKLPIMIGPKWLETRCQPIAIRNVVEMLSGVLGREDTFGRDYDIYGPDILTYKQMLLQFGEVRGLKRYIFTVPVMSPKLSSYWLYFITSTSYILAQNLVDSMKVDVIARPNDLAQKLGIKILTYKEAIKIAFDKIEQNLVLSTWKDALTYTYFTEGLSRYIKVPLFGCFKDKKRMKVDDPEAALDRVFAIGGNSGWYYADWLWQFRGFLDKLFGGVGINRGRKNTSAIFAGETLDFWRVIYSSREERRLLLYAEMRMPGEAWLEFRMGKDNILRQTATFRPVGLWGRLYWYSVLPFHYFIFNGMIRKIATGKG
ncbi:MAG: SDR family oxidoreductase [Flavobacterium sp.]|uniref:SDR family oxidoreductase n=1 Tax=Flavobacterium sp. TaxID=239 RepID=UPI00121159CA|nr:SDR family oxidoreductase [Flavobacterium sp.]RZJ66249.1 MAG: SDR family oxidoreductase [Flavobacterium sp.]